MTNDNGFECPTCKKSFKSAQGLKVHITKTHTRAEAKTKVKKNPLIRTIKGRKRKPKNGK